MSIIQSIKFVLALGLFLLILKRFSKSCSDLVSMSHQRKFFRNRSIITLALTSALLTAIVQSSSIVVIMIIGLVQGDIISEKHGLAAVMGTEIGTTMTGQLLSIPKDFLLYTIPVILFLTMIFPKTRRFKKPIIWFGLLIFSMFLMSLPLKNLINSEYSLIRQTLIKANDNKFLGISLGLGFTALIQSSSALTALTINLARMGLLNLKGSIALVLGANIGTCVTGIIASVAFSKKIKTIVIGQVIFNLLGVLAILVIFNPFLELVSLVTTTGLIERQIANGQTLFNILSFLAVLPFFSYYYLLVKKISMKFL
ncbi:Na/Pi cotransporter family protein [Alkalicella caledoniensis]|uniref:Na/Pi cotransporter family protein n=1 Tax=Alkalicella caledoniensis TaxID=2731377 RepID=A0A7G9W8M2_ALKCA|nr:Na/Pi symporter [Alkalicella caledoniensis]QNO15034.1 Na/Pi cotransporter family protein [Alkalicella caledoniensis]